jgi:hypothetical protein
MHSTPPRKSLGQRGCGPFGSSQVMAVLTGGGDPLFGGRIGARPHSRLAARRYKDGVFVGNYLSALATITIPDEEVWESSVFETVGGHRGQFGALRRVQAIAGDVEFHDHAVVH